MRVVVCDTGPLLHFSEANALGLMQVVGNVHIPELVQTELAANNRLWQKPPWLFVDTLSGAYITEARNWQLSGLLDKGEAEAIALARQLQAEWLLTDDAAARILAGSLGLEVHGSLGVVLWAAATGDLDRDAAEIILESLANSSLWVSARIIMEARAALDKLFREKS